MKSCFERTSRFVSFRQAWYLWCALPDSDSVRLKGRFLVAVGRVAIEGGAPPRVNRLDWWIKKMVRDERVRDLDDLIQRSIELWEELETNGLELGRIPPKGDAIGGLYRDRYSGHVLDPYLSLRWRTALLFRPEGGDRVLGGVRLEWVHREDFRFGKAPWKASAQ